MCMILIAVLNVLHIIPGLVGPPIDVLPGSHSYPCPRPRPHPTQCSLHPDPHPPSLSTCPRPRALHVSRHILLVRSALLVFSLPHTRHLAVPSACLRRSPHAASTASAFRPQPAFAPSLLCPSSIAPCLFSSIVNAPSTSTSLTPRADQGGV